MKAKFSNWNDRKDLGKHDTMIQMGRRPRHQGRTLSSCHGFMAAVAPLHPEKGL